MNEASTSSESNAPLWTQAQTEAMAALNLPLWQSVASQKEADTGTSSSYFYKLNNWLLICAQPLPVQLPIWLEDLFRALAFDTADQRPTEVSASVAEHNEGMFQLQLEELANAELSATQKRELWMQIYTSHD